MVAKRGPSTKYISVTDKYTGEVIDGQLTLGPPRGKKLYDWVHMFENGLLNLCRMDLTGENYRMMFFLLAQVSFENEVGVDSALCYTYTNIHPKHQSRNIKTLVEKGILRPSRKLNSVQFYDMNPLLCWKGNQKRYPTPVEMEGRVLDAWHMPHPVKRAV